MFVYPLMQQLDFFEAERLLKKYGIPFTRFDIAHSRAEAVRIAGKIGYPVVLKIVTPDILHKTEKRVVKVGLSTPAEVKKAYGEIMKSAGRARFKGMLVQKQAHGKEIIIGGKIDPQFGPVVLFGLGGIFVEIVRDVSVRVAPVSRRQARDMMKEIRGYSILTGARGEEAVDLDKIARNIVNVSKLLVEHPKVREMDLNPLFASKNRCVAVDVRIMVD
jgi:acyl-CoA synthetase (NDP forming)